MQYFLINNSDLKISVISLGTWVFSGSLWGGTRERDSIDAVLAAGDCGINLIDTAPIYGNGRSETVIGKALKGIRDQFIIATKCGLTFKGKDVVHDLTPESIRLELESSLCRLQTDYIDIYQCHWPDPDTPIEETLDELMRLKKQGKIRYIGVSNFDKELLDRCVRCAEIVTLQSQYSLLDRSLEENILPWLRENKVGLIAYGPLAGGILSGKYSQLPRFKGPDVRKFFYKHYEGEAFEKVNNLLERLEHLKRPLNQVAINWIRQQRGVASVIAGCRNARQVSDNAQAVDWELSEEDLQIVQSLLN